MWKENFSLLRYNTFGIEARCKRFAEYDSSEQLRQILQKLRDEYQDESVLCVGQGSNLLFTKDYEGTVLHSRMQQISAAPMSDGSDRSIVSAGSGWDWDSFVEYCVGHGLYGLENLSYIPGTVGASAVQNIGAYGSEVEQFIHRVHCLDIRTGERHTFGHDECRYGYRDSIFKQEWRGRYVVTEVEFLLYNTFVPQTAYGSLAKALAEQAGDEPLTAAGLRNLIISIRKSKLPEPAELGSAGSFFMNPVISREQFAELLKTYPSMPHYDVAQGVKVPAGWLIDQCGWKGRRQGAAGVYEKQALVLVNHGGATGADIVALSDTVRKDVEQKFGIRIRPEVNFI